MKIDDVKIDEIEKEIQEEIIDQKDKIDPQVEEHLAQMGFLWDRVHAKLQEDNVCFSCKGPLITEDSKQVFILEANKVDKGVIAFASICKMCNTKIEEEIKNKKTNEE